jgi:AAA15 family ATPase/GTPase
LIKYFAIENFRSFKNEQIFELDLNLNQDIHFVAQPTLGVAGANASGKSNLLQALTFVLWFMQDSFLELDENKDIPCPAFITRIGKPSQFHLIFTQVMTIKNEKTSIDEQKLIDFE